MPTDEKRREVAAKLYEMIVSTNPTWPALMEVMGTHTRGGALMEIVHLIEPESEYECRNVHVDRANDMNNGIALFQCSECGCAVNGEDAQDAYGVAPIALYEGNSVGWCRVSYCPHCGARVIDADA